MRSCNLLCHSQANDFGLAYLTAVASVAEVRFLPIGFIAIDSKWAPVAPLLIGETADSYLNCVISPMGLSLGSALTTSTFAVDSGEVNPALNPDLQALGDQSRSRNEVIYEPRTALQALFAKGQVNVAILQPLRAKREVLAVDLPILDQYDAILAPPDVADRFSALGLDGVIPADETKAASLVGAFIRRLR